MIRNFKKLTKLSKKLFLKKKLYTFLSYDASFKEIKTDKTNK